jgi:hypothetical protein
MTTFGSPVVAWRGDAGDAGDDRQLMVLRTMSL